MNTQYDYYPLTGTIDQVTPALVLQPGSAIEAVNFEPGISGGFKRVAGYERFDGRSRPSDATYHHLQVADSSGFSVGNVVTGGTSGATGTIIAIATGSIYITEKTGTFQVGETVGATTVVEVDVERDVLTPQIDQQYMNLAADHYRTLITAVPGSGPIRGVWNHNDTVYAFRDNAGATTCELYKSTVSGWTLVPLYQYIQFDAGSGEIFANDTLTGLTSGATGTVKRVLLRSGTWGGSDAEGIIVIDVTSGTFQDNEALQVSAVTKATADGANVAIDFTVGSRFEMVSYNFQATAGGYSIYGCNGIDPAFMIDENELVCPLLSKATIDNPAFIQIYRNRLFLGFLNGSVQFSVVGTPHSFVVSLGAGELGVGSNLTGMVEQPGGLIITSTRQTFLLEGSSVADFNLTTASDSTGATAYTLQSLSRVYALDDRGIISLDRANVFGNFESASISRNIQPLVDQQRPKILGSAVVRSTNQYRLFFNDGTAFATYPVQTSDGYTFNATVLDYGRPVRVICNNEDASGNERIFFGSDDGYIYEDNRGTSFDGEPIEAWVRLAFANMQSPRIRKRWRKAVFEMDADGYLQVAVTPDLSYSSPDVARSRTQDVDVAGGGGYWDTDSWDTFEWDAQTVNAAECKLFGTGTNISLLLRTFSDEYNPFTLQSVILHFDQRRLQR